MNAEEILIEFPRSRGEVLRVGWSDFEGVQRLDLRVWYTPEGTERRPTRQGVSLLPDQVSALVEALQRAGGA